MQQLTVLVVDDDKITTAILSHMLDKYADHVIIASNGEEGLSLFIEHRPDIVLTDINMPRMGGLEMVEQIRKLDEHVKIAIFTNFENRDILLQAIKFGVNQFFSKPFEAKVFAQVIQPLCDDVLEKRRISTELARQQNILHAIKKMAHNFLQHVDWKATLNTEMVRLKNAADTSAIFIYQNHIEKNELVAKRLYAVNDDVQARARKQVHYRKHHLMRWKRHLERGEYVNGSIYSYDKSKQKLLKAFKIECLLILPIFVNKEWWGFLGIGNTVDYRLNITNIEMLSTVASIIGSAINNERNLHSLEMSSAVFEHTMDGVLITNADNRIMHVNAAFSDITGYQPEEVVGKDPKFLKSGTHDKHFYQQMWTQLTQKGNWQGEITNRKKNGEIYIEWLSVNAIHNDNGEIENFIGIFSDVTHQHKDAQHNAYLATHDPLTGVSNRVLLHDRLEHAIEHAKRFDKCFAVIFCDLDNFKPINDTYGHSVGDEVLKYIAGIMKSILRKDDTLCRYGGDEFVILIEELKGFESLETVLSKIRTLSNQSFSINGIELTVGISIGAAIYPNDAQSPEAILSAADQAMYNAKKQGKNTIAFFQRHEALYCSNTYGLG
ncbi:diguanylate cyclase [Sulfurovum sp.]|uniref:diguanylate cyclase domain-containing protein n=1 Tax=Sulfurovum sp. TaxID=1969726 RepID=UPI0025D48070|nr:diguanylate cyclase [Sulfurovum sp.]